MSDERKPRGIPRTAGPSPNKINTLMELAGKKTAGPKQQFLNLNVERQPKLMDLNWAFFQMAHRSFLGARLRHSVACITALFRD